MNLLTLLCSFLILSASVGPAPAPAIINTPINDDFVIVIMEAACTISHLSCKGLQTPLVLMVDMTAGVMGFHYRGTNIVFVTSDCSKAVADIDKCTAVLMHEITHYLQSERGVNQGAGESCNNEAVAWHVYNTYVESIGRGNLLRPEWRRSYPACVGKPVN